jgi:signal transduction histidine kinase
MSPSAPPDVVIERALRTARELTGMELAFVGQFRHGRELIRRADGDAGRFGLELDDGPDLEGTYCQRVVDGRLPSAVRDTRAHPVTAALGVTAESGIGAYLGVPLRRHDGTLYGTFCCLSGEAHEELGAEHVRLMEVLARLVGDQLERQEAVEAARRARQELLASMSHDLRTPLTSIIGFAEELAAGHATPEEAAAHGAIVLRSARRLDGMLDDLLLVARAEAGALDLDRAPLELGGLAGEAVADLEAAARRGGVQVVLDAGPEPLPLLADRVHLRRVLDNLLANAVKYSPGGGRIDVRLRRDATTAVVEVEDRGIGIPEAELVHLFDRFFRASSARGREIPGTGLGLATARSLVEGHEGTITVASELGRGTTFRVRLPLDRGALG